MSTRHLVTH